MRAESGTVVQPSSANGGLRMKRLITAATLTMVLSGCLLESYAETCSRLKKDLFGAVRWSDGSFSPIDAAAMWKASGCDEKEGLEDARDN